MTSDVFSIDVQLGEDDLGHSPLHSVAAASVEALGVRKEIEREGEELLAFCQGAGGVGELRLDLGALPLDGSELLLDLFPGPLGVVEQIEQAVFLGVQFVQPAAEPSLELAHDALFGKKSVVKLAADGGLEAVSETDGAEVPVHRRLDLGDTEVRQVAEVLLASSAEEVEVDAAVALAFRDDQSVAASVAPEQPLEPVVMAAFPYATATPEREDALDAVVGFLGDERFVPAWVLLVVVGDEAAVVAVVEDLVELTEAEGFRCVTAVAPRTQASCVDLVEDFLGGVLAAGEQLDTPEDERAALRVNGDGTDLAALVFGLADVEVAERRHTDGATVLGLLAHLVADVRAAGEQCLKPVDRLGRGVPSR